MVSIYKTDGSGDIVGLNASIYGGPRYLIGREKWLDTERIQRGANDYISTFQFGDKESQDFNVNERFDGELHALQS